MGSWFSNISIRKNGGVTMDRIEEYMIKTAAAQGFSPVSSEAEADGGFAIVSDENGQWVTVYSDLFSLEDPKGFAKLAGPMSAALHTDILGIACFDSDYLYLNLLNTEERTNAWLGIGSAAGLGIRRWSRLSAWKRKVLDFPTFSDRARKRYVFAEEFLAEIEPCLALPSLQSTASYEYLKDMGLYEKAKFLYFRLPETLKTDEPPRLVQHTFSAMPCFLDRPSIVTGINVGGASKGLSVYFLGPYVAQEEITFTDVCLVKQKGNRTETVPIELQKMQLPDGQWAYHYHDPDFHILPKVDDRIPPMKRLRVESEHSITVRFVPHGNPRKILDITVVLVPDRNPAGQTGWNVWRGWGSKQAFIDQYNKSQERFRAMANTDARPQLLRAEDFDEEDDKI